MATRCPKCNFENTPDSKFCNECGTQLPPMSGRQIESVDEAMAEIYREKTPAQRLQIAFGLWRSAKILLFNLLRSVHPEWDEKRIQREVVRRISHGAI